METLSDIYFPSSIFWLGIRTNTSWTTILSREEVLEIDIHTKRGGCILHILLVLIFKVQGCREYAPKWTREMVKRRGMSWYQLIKLLVKFHNVPINLPSSEALYWIFCISCFTIEMCRSSECVLRATLYCIKLAIKLATTFSRCKTLFHKRPAALKPSRFSKSNETADVDSKLLDIPREKSIPWLNFVIDLY